MAISSQGWSWEARLAVSAMCAHGFEDHCSGLVCTHSHVPQRSVPCPHSAGPLRGHLHVGLGEGALPVVGCPQALWAYGQCTTGSPACTAGFGTFTCSRNPEGRPCCPSTLCAQPARPRCPPHALCPASTADSSALSHFVDRCSAHPHAVVCVFPDGRISRAAVLTLWDKATFTRPQGLRWEREVGRPVRFLGRQHKVP